MATHSSILVWRTSWTEEPGGLQPIAWQRRGHDWSDLACTHVQMNWLTDWDLGASLPMELGCVTVWLCSHTQRLLDPQTIGIFMEASSHRHDQSLTQFISPLSAMKKRDLRRKFQASNHNLFLPVTNPQPRAHPESPQEFTRVLGALYQGQCQRSNIRTRDAPHDLIT